jgi:hypothetical protein
MSRNEVRLTTTARLLGALSVIKRSFVIQPPELKVYPIPAGQALRSTLQFHQSHIHNERDRQQNHAQR